MNDKRIKLKCLNGQPLFAIILVTLIFTGAGLGMLFLPVKDFLKTGSLLKVNPGFLALGAVGIFFAGMGMYFVFLLLKPARAYKGTLVEKKMGENGGYQYTFQAVPNPTKESLISSAYICSCKESIDLYEGDDCILYLKEATWAAKAPQILSWRAMKSLPSAAR